MDCHALPKIIEHILYVGSFTGLSLNMEKTIAFNYQINGKHIVHGFTLVKYLGAFLGQGDLSKLNFEKPLRLAQQKINAWPNRNLTLKARVLVAKTFVFSLFVHILNSVYISMEQLDLLQKLLNNFL